eukprot:1972726-Alexandrium_andersonii.AAC.1
MVLPNKTPTKEDFEAVLKDRQRNVSIRAMGTFGREKAAGVKTRVGLRVLAWGPLGIQREPRNCASLR